MKAVTYRQYGNSSVLAIENIDKPVSKPEQYEIKVHAAEVTKADCELRSFNFPVKWFWLPLRLALGVFKPRKPVLGGYFAGTVNKASETDRRFKVGDRVFGNTGSGFGAHAEFLSVSASNSMVVMPEDITFADAAALPLGALNAIHFMTIASLRAGQSILIMGAGGSIGLSAVQIAIAKGAQVTVVDKAQKQEMLTQLGVSEFIDYQKQDIYEFGRQYDVVFSMVAGSPFTKNLQLVKPGGVYLMGNPTFADMLLSVLMPMLTRKKVLFRFAKESEADLNELVKLIEAGHIQAVIDSVLPMEQVQEAHDRVEKELRNGSVILAIHQEG